MTQDENMKDMQIFDGCVAAGVTNYTLELNAAKFGDTDGSFAVHHLSNSFWKNNFSIEMEFRTFYKSGMILFTQVNLVVHFLQNMIFLYLTKLAIKIYRCLKVEYFDKSGNLLKLCYILSYY